MVQAFCRANGHTTSLTWHQLGHYDEPKKGQVPKRINLFTYTTINTNNTNNNEQRTGTGCGWSWQFH